jgi:hypothetical protein
MTWAALLTLCAHLTGACEQVTITVEAGSEIMCRVRAASIGRSYAPIGYSFDSDAILCHEVPS